MVTLRSHRELLQMRKAGLVVWQALQLAGELVRPGATTASIDAVVDRFFECSPGRFRCSKACPAGFRFRPSTCISVNEEVVHGIPGPRSAERGRRRQRRHRLQAERLVRRFGDHVSRRTSVARGAEAVGCHAAAC